jgi:hypothetical protein
LFLDISFQTDRILHIYLRKRKVYNETQAADDVTLNSFTSRFKTSFEIVGAASREKVGWVSHKKMNPHMLMLSLNEDESVLRIVG